MRITFSKFFMLCASVAVLFSNAAQVEAGFYFNVTNVTITPGNGIGTELLVGGAPAPMGAGVGFETGSGGGQLLGVDHTTNAAPGVFIIPAFTPHSFAAGAVKFNSSEISITTNEAKNTLAHNINFQIGLTFVDPNGNVQNKNLFLVGTAITGTVTDGGNVNNTVVDYSLALASTSGNFLGGLGDPGTYTITSGAPVTLSNFFQNPNLNVVFTVTVAPVPEPTSMALLGLGAIGAVVSSYRRKRAV